MKDVKTIRLEPDIKAALETVLLKGVPEHAVLLYLLDQGIQHAQKLPTNALLAEVTRHRQKVLLASTERRIKAMGETPTE